MNNKNNERIKRLIRTNNYQEFTNSIKTLAGLSLEQIDQELLENKDFNIQAKIDYCDYFDRKELLDSLKRDMSLNSSFYNYYAFTYFTLSKVKEKESKNSSLMLAFTFTPNNEVKRFKSLLENHNYYDEFINIIQKTSSSYLKIKASVFLDDSLVPKLFGNYKILIDNINSSSISSKAKIEYYLHLYNKLHNQELLDKLRELILSTYDKYNEKLYEELSKLDEELIEQHKIKEEEYLKAVMSVLNKNGESLKLK